MKRRTVATVCALVLTFSVLTSEIVAHDAATEPDTVASLLWLPMI